MVRLLGFLAGAVLLTLCAAASRAEAPSRQQWELGIDLGYVHASGYPSWTSGSVGKLRYDASNDGWVANRGFAEYRLRIADTLDARIAAEAYDDDIGASLDVTQAYMEWRPLTLSETRYRLKVGAFYPRLSLENAEPGWGNAYTVSSSAINTWIAEEIRIVGTELSVSRRPQALGGAHSFSLQAAAFFDNDPSGTLLAWKGWSLHDRQTRFGDELPLPWLPQIRDGAVFRFQDHYSAPFTEADDRVGFYVGGEWRYGTRLLLRAMHFDNRGDPQKFKSGQYAWGTSFDHVGVQASLPGNIGLIGQWMHGKTNMGRAYQGHYMVDVRYASHFVLLTRAIGQHRVTARYDHFDVTDVDQLPLDDNSEAGHAWTIAYRFQVSAYAALALEGLQVHSKRPAWAYNGFATARSERQIQASVRLRFGGH